MSCYSTRAVKYKQNLIKKNIRLAILNGKTPLGKIYKKILSRRVLTSYLKKAIWDAKTKCGRIYFDIRLKRDGLENMFVE
jgi:hypothetical protein